MHIGQPECAGRPDIALSGVAVDHGDFAMKTEEAVCQVRGEKCLAAVHFSEDHDHAGMLEFAKGMWEPEEAELWQKDLTGRLVHWIEVGQPDERRLVKASGRADRVSVYAFSHGALAWWAGLSARVGRAGNVDAWLVPSEQSRELALLAQRNMQLQVNRQDGIVWVADGDRSVEIHPRRLSAEPR